MVECSRRISNAAMLMWIFCFLDSENYGSATPKYETLLERVSPLSSVHKRLEKFNKNLQNDLTRRPTLNEVDELGYYNDQEEVERALERKKNISKYEKNYSTINFSNQLLVIENKRNVFWNGRCELPTKRCIPVDSSAISKDGTVFTYDPRCALVYKCGEDSGCCHSKEHSCVSIRSNLIHLYFNKYVLSEEEDKSRGMIVKLSFENDTRCACRKNKMLPVESCHCPKNFVPDFRIENECVCVCSKPESKFCWKIREGRRIFNMSGCIKKGKCGVPLCEHGAFMEELGRCPRKSRRTKRGRRKNRRKL